MVAVVPDSRIQTMLMGAHRRSAGFLSRPQRRQSPRGCDQKTRMDDRQASRLHQPPAERLTRASRADALAADSHDRVTGSCKFRSFVMLPHSSRGRQKCLLLHEENRIISSKPQACASSARPSVRHAMPMSHGSKIVLRLSSGRYFGMMPRIELCEIRSRIFAVRTMYRNGRGQSKRLGFEL